MTRVSRSYLAAELAQALALEMLKILWLRDLRGYLRAPNTFFSNTLPVPTGSWRIFFSSSPIM